MPALDDQTYGSDVAPYVAYYQISASVAEAGLVAEHSLAVAWHTGTLWG
jgi:hypothetical protein